MAEQQKRARRAPDPDDRRRDPDRTRRALLDAALEEFADKGRAGARVSEIAARAGVNKQLISYYFGGKDGLYDAILERWHSEERSWEQEDISLEELVMRYLTASVEQRTLQRAFMREMLDDDLGAKPRDHERPDTDDVAELRRRQEAGELAPDLDPALVLILLQGAVSVGVTFARDVRDLVGVDPGSPEWVELYGALLRRVVRSLAEPESR